MEDVREAMPDTDNTHERDEATMNEANAPRKNIIRRFVEENPILVALIIWTVFGSGRRK